MKNKPKNTEEIVDALKGAFFLTSKECAILEAIFSHHQNFTDERLFCTSAKDYFYIAKIGGPIECVENNLFTLSENGEELLNQVFDVKIINLPKLARNGKKNS